MQIAKIIKHVCFIQVSICFYLSYLCLVYVYLYIRYSSIYIYISIQIYQIYSDIFITYRYTLQIYICIHIDKDMIDIDTYIFTYVYIYIYMHIDIDTNRQIDRQIERQITLFQKDKQIQITVIFFVFSNQFCKFYVVFHILIFHFGQQVNMFMNKT